MPLKSLFNKGAQREYFIDNLKGICILMVIFTHYAWTPEERVLLFFPWWVDMAVPVFMILSGYVYRKAADRRNIQTLSQFYTCKNLTKKLLRYLMPFIIVYLFELLFDRLLPVGAVEYSALRTLFVGGIGPGAYYVPVMTQFIFIAPVIYLIIKRREFHGLILCLLINFIYEFLHVMYDLPVATYRLLVFRYIFLIAVGCYLASEKQLKKNAFVFMFLAGTTFLAMTCYLHYRPKILIDWTRTCFLSSMYVVPIVAVLLRKGQKLRCKPLELIGRASYHIFLIQMVYYYRLCKYVYSAINNRYSQILVGMVLCTTIGIVFYYIETAITQRMFACFKRDSQRTNS